MSFLPHERIVFAMDVPSMADAMNLASALKGHIGAIKVGLELFSSAGPSSVEKFAKDFKVFLDLKLHDIPTTVGKVARAARSMGAEWITVHATAGEDALCAAVADHPGVLAVLSLTSAGLGWRARRSLAKNLDAARTANCHGLVCPGWGLPKISPVAWAWYRRRMPVFVPGVCLRDGSPRDHGDSATYPERAMAGGADYIVVGRPIRDSSDPAREADGFAWAVARGLDRRG